MAKMRKTSKAAGRKKTHRIRLDAPAFYPVILAGGRGTRFWPLSRSSMAKQLLPLNSDRSMLQETVLRLLPASRAENFWVITNRDLHAGVRHQLRGLPASQMLAEPVGRNTAPAIGLAAFLLLHRDPDAILGLFPADHVIADEARFRRDLKLAIEVARAGENIVVMGVKPARAETGYGYVETGAPERDGVLRVRRFVEKPDATRAAEYVRAGNFYWNSGMFVWSAATLAGALMEYLPETAELLDEIASAWGTKKFEAAYRRLYPRCTDKSVDYAVLEPRSARGEGASGIYCIPAEFGWNDLGSWSAHYEHRLAQARARRKAAPGDNVVLANGSYLADAAGNYLHAPGKFVAAVGVSGLVVVDTGDALLITTRERAQDVGKIVKHLDESKHRKLT